MPNNVVKSFAQKTGKSKEEIESVWKETEAQVKKEYPDKEDIYGLVTSIVKKKIGLNENESIKDLIRKKLDETKGTSEKEDEDKALMKKFYQFKESDKNTKFYRNDVKWAKVYKDFTKKYFITLGRKGELTVPKLNTRIRETSDKAMMETIVAGWFKYND